MLDADQHGLHAAPAMMVGVIRKSSWSWTPSALFEAMKSIRNSCRPDWKILSMRP
jgi:hypothetical protein